MEREDEYLQKHEALGNTVYLLKQALNLKADELFSKITLGHVMRGIVTFIEVLK